MILTDGRPTIAWAPRANGSGGRSTRHHVELTADEVDLLAEALDSHRYWQLSDESYRNSGYVIPPGSDEPEKVDGIRRTEELEDRLRALLR